MIIFTKHAQEKFRILAKHNVAIGREKVITTVLKPDTLDATSRFPLIIAQSMLDTKHVLRVIYKQESGNKVVITFYPGRIKQYG